MSGYASGTSVAIGKSRSEIDALLQRYKATEVSSGWTQDEAAVGFMIKGFRVRIRVAMPTPDQFLKRRPKLAQRVAACEQETRRRWRSIVLVLKAKLEAVDSGISTIETEFLAFLVLPGQSRTFGELALPAIGEVYANGGGPLMLGTGT